MARYGKTDGDGTERRTLSLGPRDGADVDFVAGAFDQDAVTERTALDGEQVVRRGDVVEDLVDTDRDEDTLASPNDPLRINMGPSHPATHGTVHLVLTLDGERVVGCEVELGYLHRGFEKESEAATYNQVFPYVDRLNYASPMLNNVGYALAVEKLLDITDEVPLRAQYLRVIAGELSRITDHLTCNGASAMELASFTAFLWMMKARDELYDLLEELSGARLTYSYCRVGGVARDARPDWTDSVRRVLLRVERVLDDVRRVLVDNRIFRERMEGVGVIGPAEAMQWGFTGPQMRASGLAIDVRKDAPYLVYDRLDFDVPVGTRGDCWDRFMVRMEEMRQSMRMLRQAAGELDALESGPVLVDEPLVTLPPKDAVYDSIEGMIRHFKVVFDGVRVPPGETYGYTEAGNGELGFYLVSDGTGRPYKCRCRGPSFTMTQALPRLLVGGLVSDVVPNFGMINYIAGEAER